MSLRKVVASAFDVLASQRMLQENEISESLDIWWGWGLANCKSFISRCRCVWESRRVGVEVRESCGV